MFVFNKVKITIICFVVFGVLNSGNTNAEEPKSIVSLPPEVVDFIASKLDDKSVVAFSKTCRKFNLETSRNRIPRKLTQELIGKLKEIHVVVWEKFGSLWPFMRGFGPLQMEATKALIKRTLMEFLNCTECTTQNPRELYLTHLCKELPVPLSVDEIGSIDGFLYEGSYYYTDLDEQILNLYTQLRNEAWSTYLCSMQSLIRQSNEAERRELIKNTLESLVDFER